MASRSGMRDYGKGTTISDSLIELYWNIILLTESKFLIDATNINSFRKNLVRKFSQKFNTINRKKPFGSHSSLAQWRSIGDSYFLVYLPFHFNDIIYCKTINNCLHLTLSNTFKLFFNNKQDSQPFKNNSNKNTTNFKDLLLIFLEFAYKQDCSLIKFYFEKDSNSINSITDFKIILKNLNWIGGKISKNEDRESCFNDLSLDDLMSTDENYLILQFEC